MTTPFDNLTLAQLRQRLADVTPAWIAENAAFYAGDLWQGGRGWIGPQPQPGEPGYAQTMTQIKKVFTGKNAIGEVVGRHVGGVVGREPSWSLVPRRPLEDDEAPSTEEQALIDEAEALLTAWWDERSLHDLIQQAAATLLYAGRSGLRLFVPEGRVETDPELGEVLPAVADLGAGLAQVYVEHPEPRQATVVTDRRTQQQAGLYLATDPDTRALVAEASYVDGDAVVVALLDRRGQRRRADGSPEIARLPGVTQPLLYEVKRPPLVSEPVRQLQRQLSLARTMLGHNIIVAGFVERLLLNAQLPGDYVKDPETNEERFVPDPNFKVGPNQMNFITGLPIEDEDGGVTGYTNPSVVFRPPADGATLENGERSAYRAILEECHQVHALIAGDATASGESRRQAMADYLTDLLRTKPQLQRLIRWLLETALALAAAFAQQPGRYASLRAEVQLRLDPGPLSADDRRLIIEMAAQELLPVEDAMSMLGVEDVDAALAKIAARKAERQQAAQQMQALVPGTNPQNPPQAPPSAPARTPAATTTGDTQQ